MMSPCAWAMKVRLWDGWQTPCCCLLFASDFDLQGDSSRCPGEIKYGWCYWFNFLPDMLLFSLRVGYNWDHFLDPGLTSTWSFSFETPLEVQHFLVCAFEESWK